MNDLKPIRIIALFLLSVISYSPAQKWEVLKSSESELVIHYHFRENETPFQLVETYLPIGFPGENLPEIVVNQINASPYSETVSQKYNFTPTSEFLNWDFHGRFRNLNSGTIKISPLFLSQTSNLNQVKNIVFTIKFLVVVHPVSGQAGKWERALYENRIINWDIANRWLMPTEFRRTFRLDQPITPDILMDSTLQADYVIITHGDFTEAAETLANYRESKGMTSIVAKLSVIESDFNSEGNIEGYEAIKAFLQFAFDSWVEPRPAYVLLIGDGPEPMPTHHQSWQNYSSDLRYVYLNPDSSTTPQMAIGRIPVNTLQEAESVIEKTIAYESTPEPGLWRRSITLVADDFSAPNNNLSLEKTHITNSESLYVRIPNTLEVKKLYLEEYPAENSGSQTGVVKPDATEALFNILETGTVLINYIGHGHPGQWAHEVLLSASRGDLFSINTGMKLPIWIAGTCSWGQYDSDEGDAMSEDLLIDPQNGAIAIISTIEKISYSANEAFIIALFDKLFPNREISPDPLGSVFLGNQINDRNEMFHLFGDPALTMGFPIGEVEISEVNPDTLYTLATGSYSGQVSDPSAPSTASGFSLIYEADREVSLQFNEDTIKYTIPGRTLFRGQIDVENYQYNGSFIIPKDVDYSSSEGGSFGVYVYKMDNDELIWEGLGILDSLHFAGNNTLSDDTQGPIISFFQNNSNIGWGDFLSRDADLTINLVDENGINITGETGHSIRLWFNEDENDFIDLTHLFIYDEGEYSSGEIDYPLSLVESDELFITVEAWDNANNSTQESIKLNLLTSSGLTLNNVFNYPNPFSLNTQFTFDVSEDSEIEIKIYTLNGVLVNKIEPLDYFQTSFNGFGIIDWDGIDEFGDNIANGVYLYELEATSTVSGKKVSHIGKLAKFR